MRSVNGVRGSGVERVVDQGGFARARHAGHAGEQSHGEFDVHAFQVVAAGTHDLDEVLASLDPLAFVELLSFVASYLEAINDIVGDARIDFPDTDMGVDAGKLNKATRSVLFGIRKAKEILK